MRATFSGHSFLVSEKSNVYFNDVNGVRRGPFWNLFSSCQWEAEALNLLIGSLATKPGALMDVGAWIGPFSLLAASMGREVVAFEPDPVAFDLLRANVAAAGFEALVDTRQMALWSNEGNLRLFASELGDSETSIADKRTRAGKEIQVDRYIDAPARRLDDTSIAVPEPIAVLKIDIEGAEYHLLDQIANYLDKQRCDLILSLHPENLSGMPLDQARVRSGLDQLIGLKAKGFRFNFSIDDKSANSEAVGDFGAHALSRLQAIHVSAPNRVLGG